MYFLNGMSDEWTVQASHWRSSLLEKSASFTYEILFNCDINFSKYLGI